MENHYGKAGGIAWRCSDTDGFGTAGAVLVVVFGGIGLGGLLLMAEPSSDRFCRQYRHFLFGCFKRTTLATVLSYVIVVFWS